MNCPYNRISGAPVNGISQSSTCIWAFLISLKKMSFPTGSDIILLEIPRKIQNFGK
jgi:hypothetical protein